MNKSIQLSLIIILLIFLIISGYAIANFYYETRDAGSFVDEGKLQDSNYRQAKEDIELFHQVLADAELNRNDVLARLDISVTELFSEDQILNLEDDHKLSWTKRVKFIEVPVYARHPQTMDKVITNLIRAGKKPGAQLFKTESLEFADHREKSLYFGFVYHDKEIITDIYLLYEVKPKAQLAIIIDDLGNNQTEFAQMMTIPRPITFAVIPHLPRSVKQARKVQAEGYDLILHQPMEAFSEQNLGAGGIYTDMTEEEIMIILQENLAALPAGLIGVNNHMGSKATSDERVMDIVLKFFKDQEMFFIDSSTSSKSVVGTVAVELGEAYGENNIFLDNVDELEAIKGQITKAAKIALRKGQAIAIGHVRKYTAKAILTMVDELEKMGVQLVYAKDLLHEFR